MAPTVYYEQLEYDCRLMNTATAKGAGKAKELADMLVDSDVKHDPQALILAPEHAITISQAVVNSSNYVTAAKNAVLSGMDIINDAWLSGVLELEQRDADWIEIIRDAVSTIPDNEDDFINETVPLLNRNNFIPEEYGIEE